MMFFLVIVWFSLFVGGSLATHFRGAHFWFRSINNVPNQAEIGFRLTWRMSYSPTTRCNHGVIDAGSLIGPETPGYVMCDVGCKERVGDVSIRCLDYSSLEDWMTGDRSYNHTFQGNGSYQIVWDGNGWFKDDVPWQIRMTLNLNPRSSNGGRVNSSPRADLPSFPINVQRGCSVSIRIAVVDDDDGDVVRCRWADSMRQECGGVCHDSTGVGQPIATLLQDTCTIQLNAFQMPDKYIIALQLEDFDASDQLFQSPLSSVPLQFSIGLYSTNDTNSTTTTASSNATGGGEPSWCQIGPVFVPPTPKDGSCLRMDRTNNISITIAAKSKDSVTIVFKIQSVGPIVYADVRQTEVASNGFIFYVIVSMAADDVSQEEDRTFCFSAIDNFGFTSNKTCFNISFGLHPPQATAATYDTSTRNIVIIFNQSQLIRPLTQKLVSVYDDQNQLLTTYDTTSTDQVTFNNNTITMTPTEQMFNSIGCYHIHLQTGSVLSLCGAESLEVINSTSLNFTTNRSVGVQCGFTTGRQPTTITTSTGVTHPPFNSSSPPSSAAAAGDGSSSWDYRWLVVAVVCSLLLFTIVALVTAYVIKRAKTRGLSRRSRQQRFFSTLDTRGIYNWSYDQQRQHQHQWTNSTPDTTTTTTEDTTVRS